MNRQLIRDAFRDNYAADDCGNKYGLMKLKDGMTVLEFVLDQVDKEKVQTVVDFLQTSSDDLDQKANLLKLSISDLKVVIEHENQSYANFKSWVDHVTAPTWAGMARRNVDPGALVLAEQDMKKSFERGLMASQALYSKLKSIFKDESSDKKET